MAEKQKTRESESALYDLGYHLIDSIPEGEVASHVADVEKLLEKAGASVTGSRTPRSISLAYTISRMTKGKREDYTASYFGTIVFQCERDVLAKIEKALSGHTEILRYLIIETDEKKAEEALKDDRVPEKAEEAPAVSDDELNKSIEALTA